MLRSSNHIHLDFDDAGADLGATGFMELQNIAMGDERDHFEAAPVRESLQEPPIIPDSVGVTTSVPDPPGDETAR